ncbi:MAG: CDP-diacylglycerol--glycerol-3-phosphate 3-phosphatidyltransferase [Desulfobacterales bacterium]|jgi:cardiolipin synthase|nr:CDP-diacylglycerol--glycerol-3-phosphate 3-phosphatidyltransferase [Desulfobacterales bacterium]
MAILQRAGFPRRPKLTINIPNILTVLRILVIPLFVILLIRDFHAYALLVFIAAGVSDGLDGLIARALNQRSELGAILDPIADKLLLTAAYVTLGVLTDIPGWLVVVVISRDVLIVTGIAVLTFTRVPFTIRPSLVSKWTTVAQVVTIAFNLTDLQTAWAGTAMHSLYWITAAMTVLSGLHYTYVGLHILQTGVGNGAEKNGGSKAGLGK